MEISSLSFLIPATARNGPATLHQATPADSPLTLPKGVEGLPEAFPGRPTAFLQTQHHGTANWRRLGNAEGIPPVVQATNNNNKEEEEAAEPQAGAPRLPPTKVEERKIF